MKDPYKLNNLSPTIYQSQKTKWHQSHILIAHKKKKKKNYQSQKIKWHQSYILIALVCKFFVKTMGKLHFIP